MKIPLAVKTGFICKVLVLEFIKQDLNLSIVVCQKTNLFPNQAKQFEVGDFESNSDFTDILTKFDCVIHLTGKVRDLLGWHPIKTIDSQLKNYIQ
jgi:hypothetical protein|tara:strand:+ start:634 stop:918 length:285 start_codon:yes stop_codon:yes gene_type:complete